MSNPSPSIPFDCSLCRQRTAAALESVLGLLALCAGCQEKRFARGEEAQRKAARQ
jgi:hypothetical protein